MEKTRSFKYAAAHILRICSVPPLMVITLILLLTFKRNDIFVNLTDTVMAIICLAVIPALAYPLSVQIPSLREKGREGQRSLAFVLSAVGYVLGFFYGLFRAESPLLTLIFTTYLVSVICLLLCNKVLKVRASGHACSVAGVLMISALFLSRIGVIASLAAYVLILWASVTSGRHTVREYLTGTACCAAALLISWFCCIIVPGL